MWPDATASSATLPLVSGALEVKGIESIMSERIDATTVEGSGSSTGIMSSGRISSILFSAKFRANSSGNSEAAADTLSSSTAISG